MHEDNHWRDFLQSEFEHVQFSESSTRTWTFDIDDEPELLQAALDDFPQLRTALTFLQNEVRPKLVAADREALEFQMKRRWTAWWAILPGIGAVVLAILQLMLTHLLPKLVGAVAIMEIASVILAAIAVWMGFWWQSHHRWLTRRQTAERLRNLKFRSLGWHELWSNEAAWKTRVTSKISEIVNLTDQEAEHWATTEDDMTPQKVGDPGCVVDLSELRALCDYYLIKRLKFQKAYFDRQSKRADVNSWSARWKVSLWMFFASVAIVFLHGLLAFLLAEPAADDSTQHAATTENQHNSPLHQLEIGLIGLAALLPVIGFGIRAWTAAFEFPRSRNLFRAKSFALNELIEFLEIDSGDLTKTMHHISHAEHFFLAEHREWCRLQIESEWYV